MMLHLGYRCYKARNGNLIVDKENEVFNNSRAVYNTSSHAITYRKKIPESIINYFVNYYKREGIL